MNLQQWIQQVTNLDNFDFAGFICNELIDNKLNLDRAIFSESFPRSFSTPQVIVSIECWTASMLSKLHTYLRKTPGKIENFYVISLGHFGIHDWWTKNCLEEKTFTSIEVADIPFGDNYCTNLAHENWTPKFWNRNLWYNDSHGVDLTARLPLTHYFCYMAGTNPGSLDDGFAKQYLALQMLNFEPLSKVSLAWTLCPKDTLKHWVDYKTYWQRQDLVDLVDSTYDKFIHRSLDKIPKQDFIIDSVYLYQQSFAQVVRETVMDQPFSCFSEKTYRSFIFGQFMIPTPWKSVQYLENLGFLFDHNMFDYSYQHERNVVFRFNRMCQAIDEFVKSHSLLDLETYQQTHRDLFLHNQSLALKLTKLYET